MNGLCLNLTQFISRKHIKILFIHNDSVAIGHQGYLYSKYHRKYIK